MVKKKLLVITGAGASVECGMPSVLEVDNMFRKWAKTILPLANTPNQSLYDYVENEINKYYASKSGREIKSSNFEEMLYVFEMISAMLKDGFAGFGNTYPLNALATLKKLPKTKTISGEYENDYVMISNLTSYLVDKLLLEFRTKCLNLSKDKKEELNTISTFFNELHSHFDLGVVTVNYDDILLQAIPSLITGFNKEGRFEPEIVFNTDWHFYYSLHGCVHYDMKGGKDLYNMHDIHWSNDLSGKFNQNSSGRSGLSSMEGHNILTSSIIAGYDKSNKILRQPFRTYFSQLERLIYEADCYLICGYGFADMHINSFLSSIRDNNGVCKKIIVITYGNDNEEPLQYRNDSWSYNITGSLIIDNFSMGSRTSKLAPSIRDLRRDKEFEISYNKDLPTAIWYGGFLEACRNPENFINEFQ